MAHIKSLWKQLPHESKKYWEFKGRGGASKLLKNPNESVTQLKKVLKLGS